MSLVEVMVAVTILSIVVGGALKLISQGNRVQTAQSLNVDLLLVKQSFLLMSGSLPDFAAALNHAENRGLKRCLNLGTCPMALSPIMIKVPGERGLMAGIPSMPAMISDKGTSCVFGAESSCRTGIYGSYRGICELGRAVCSSPRFIEIAVHKRTLGIGRGSAGSRSDSVQISRIIVPTEGLKTAIANLSGGGSDDCASDSVLVGSVCVRTTCLSLPD